MSRQQTDPFAIIEEKNQATHWLRLGQIKPEGWLFDQIYDDLENGFVGCLDDLLPELIISDQIYGPDRLSGKIKSKDLGLFSPDPDQSAHYLWWNSESQSNWWDGLIRSAILLDQPHYLNKAQNYVNQMLSYQDEDGYMGIYAPDLRFNFSDENGELWAQASMMRALLGYYEGTGAEEVLQALQRAAAVIMAAYPRGSSSPFAVSHSVGGVGHGLTLTDVLTRLHQLTGQSGYLLYAHWLYQAYCQGSAAERDLVYSNLMDPAAPFQAHGVHTYEHLRSLLAAVYAGGNPLLEEALAKAMIKLERCLTASGGPIGDEWIAGRDAHPSETGYEYCSIQELLDSYSHLMQMSGDPIWADRIEWLLFNAGQGARHPSEHAIAYLKTDNSTSMVGKQHPDDEDDPREPQRRYKYSPTHQDVAVCCVPNAGRIYPYYVKAMWLRTPEGVAAMLYGPCRLQTQIEGVPLRIVQKTQYPFDHQIVLQIFVDRPLDFEIALRKPGWAAGQTLQAPGARSVEENGLIRLRKVWQTGDEIDIAWQAAISTQSDTLGNQTISYGPLLYALPIKAAGQAVRDYAEPGFHDWYYRPKAAVPDNPILFRKSLQLGERRSHAPRGWSSSPLISAIILDAVTLASRTVDLLPIGETLLRQTTFTFVEGSQS